MSALFFPICFEPFSDLVHYFSPGLFRQDTQQAWWTIFQFKVGGVLPSLLQLQEDCFIFLLLVPTSFSATLDVLCKVVVYEHSVL